MQKKKLVKDDVADMFGKARQGAKESGDIKQLPPGKYNAKLSKCEYRTSQKGDRYIVHKWTVMEGSQEGELAQDWRKVESENGIKFTLMEWNKLGADVDSVGNYEQLEKMAEWVEAQGFICRVRIAQNKNNPDFQNFYIEEVLDQQGESEEGDAGAEPEGEESEAEGSDDSDEDGDDDESVEVGDVVEFKHEGKLVQKAVVGMDEDSGTILVKVGKEKVSIKIDAVIRKITE